MNKLPCYGITARALQILVGASAPIHEIPAKWFNWVGRAPVYQSSLPPFAPERLSIVSAPQEAPNSAARWCKNSLAAGYDCIFIDSVDDEHCVDELGLGNGIGYDIVAPSESGRTENPRLQNELREPDEAIVLLWDNLRLGGGAPIEKMGFAEVTVMQWIAYGRSMHDWIQQNSEGNGTSVRTETPDFSKWNPWERFGGASRMLSLSEHFDTLPTDHWPWSVENPITKKDVPNLASDIEAFWPMRQMPFCGVVRTFAGELKAVGALPDTKDKNGNWLWDDGKIRGALMTALPSKESLLQKALNFFNYNSAGLAHWKFSDPFRADSGGGGGGVHRLINGERIEITWTEDSIRIEHTRSAGGESDLWLTAILDTPEGGEFIGSWQYSTLFVTCTPGIPAHFDQNYITFGITDCKFKGL